MRHTRNDAGHDSQLSGAIHENTAVVQQLDAAIQRCDSIVQMVTMILVHNALYTSINATA